MNGVIEIATGDLLRAGFADFANDGQLDATTEQARTDVPEPAKVRFQRGETQMHRWDGAAWILVSQPTRPPTPTELVLLAAFSAIEPQASSVVANDRPAIECQPSAGAFAAAQTMWPNEINSLAKVWACIRFILKSAGTGSNVRIAMKAKADAPGDDSSAAFPSKDFVIVPVTHTLIGEVFEGEIEIDASTFVKDASVALQIGRDGNNSLGAGSNDDVDVPIQIISIKTEAR